MARRTQAERSASTRAALIAAAREQFAEHGFAGVGAEGIATTAGVSRGAMYHHFADKTELFAAALVAVESEVADRIAAAALDGEDLGFVSVMMRAVNAWLDACEAPEVYRIVLLDGPSVLGWQRWRDLCYPYVLAMVEGLVTQAITDGSIPPLPPRPLAHVFIAIAEEAAMYVATAPDAPDARAEMIAVTRAMLAALNAGTPTVAPPPPA